MLEILKRGHDEFGYQAVSAEFEAQGARINAVPEQRDRCRPLAWLAGDGRSMITLPELQTSRGKRLPMAHWILGQPSYRANFNPGHGRANTGRARARPAARCAARQYHHPAARRLNTT